MGARVYDHPTLTFSGLKEKLREFFPFCFYISARGMEGQQNGEMKGRQEGWNEERRETNLACTQVGGFLSDDPLRVVLGVLEAGE